VEFSIGVFPSPPGKNGLVLFTSKDNSQEAKGTPMVINSCITFSVQAWIQICQILTPWSCHFFFFFFVFRDRVSQYSLGCPGTHSVDQAGLELRDPPASQVLGLTVFSYFKEMPLIKQTEISFCLFVFSKEIVLSSQRGNPHRSQRLFWVWNRASLCYPAWCRLHNVVKAQIALELTEIHLPLPPGCLN
jgi:hypothetical protein